MSQGCLPDLLRCWSGGLYTKFQYNQLCDAVMHVKRGMGGEQTYPTQVSKCPRPREVYNRHIGASRPTSWRPQTMHAPKALSRAEIAAKQNQAPEVENTPWL